jgi:glycosyltransferase involved in cell wall biosynthesis
VGYVGRLQVAKGVSDLISAFEHVVRSLPGAHLVLVGDGLDRRVLENRVRTLGLVPVVHFTGHQDDPWPYYCAFDAFVLATPEHEGISQALRQAMFAGCPVVATEIGGNPEVVRHGDTGLLVPPADPVRLAGALIRVLGNRPEAVARAARARVVVESAHTLDHMGERLLELYRRHLPA